MKILWILGELPIPPDSGTKMRIWGLLKELAARHEVTAAILNPGPNATKRIEQLADVCSQVEMLPWRGRPSKTGMMLGAAATIVAKLPYAVIKYCGFETEMALAGLATGDFDIIQCENLGFRRYFSRQITAPTILDTHNIEAHIWQQRAKLARNPLLRAYLHSQASKMAKYEKWLLKKYNRVIAVSEEDKTAIQCEYGIDQVGVVFNAVDIIYFQPSPETPEQDLIVFSGAMDYTPNDDAMKYFLKEIWPTILQQHPAAHTVIVGRNPSKSLYALVEKTPRVEITGWVPDTRPYLARASVIVVPLRMGGGSRLKILEAMAMKKRIVSTSIGAEGIAVTSGKHLLITDTPKDFANTVVSLLANAALNKEMEPAARALVETQYSWQASAKRLEEVWLNVRSGLSHE